jgi:hypothetical protein
MKMLSYALSILIIFFSSIEVHSSAMLTYTFDDGGINTLNAFNILTEHNQVGVVGPVIKNIIDWPNSHLSYEQLRRFQNNGWEIASHSLGHPGLPNIPLRYQDEIISGWVYTGNAGIYKTSYNFPELKYVLQNGDNFNLVSKGGDRLVSVTSIDQLTYNANNNIGSFFYDSSTNTVYLRTKYGDDPSSHTIRANSAERELDQSKREFQSEGLEITTFLVPYSQWNTELRDMSKDFYSAVASTKGNFINTIPPYDSHWLSRRWPGDDTPIETVQSWIQDAIDNEYWLILGFHNIADGFFQQRKI